MDDAEGVNVVKPITNLCEVLQHGALSEMIILLITYEIFECSSLSKQHNYGEAVFALEMVVVADDHRMLHLAEKLGFNSIPCSSFFESPSRGIILMTT
ncbi:hypothetical protein PENTCL1PPCAC_24442, partial [Pristionchus entomophagus]